MSEEIAQLKALLEREQQENKWIRDANNALAEKNKKLIEALKFYANKNTWYAESNPYGYTYGLIPNFDCDASSEHRGLRFGGRLARKALEENDK